MKKALENIRVLDLSRVLAGPFCTQMLGDLGAEILKIEKPGEGDDTRSWGPPFLQDSQGRDTNESAYYLSCNRNKKSLAIDIKTPQGQDLIHRLLAQSDILIENFKVGGLAKYGLGYEQLKEKFPHLIYCSITGYGQNGPLAAEPGYDYVAQGMSGLMSITGEPEGQPMKAGVALSDIITGQNAAIGILAALQARSTTGRGQHVDVALLDCSLAAMTNIAQYYLTSGHNAPRLGNAHSTIVPYQTFETADGHIIVAVGNNTQFARLCTHLGHEEWAKDPRFATNSARVQHRETLVPLIQTAFMARSTDDWLTDLRAADVPCGRVNTMDQVFAEPQVQARDMQIRMHHPGTSQAISLVGSPLKLSDTPVQYELPPPRLGAHTQDVLKNLLELPEAEIQDLIEKKIIQ